MVTYMGFPLVVNRLVPPGEAILVGVGLPKYKRMGEECVVVHPLTFLRIKFRRFPMWSNKTLGHREADIDRRRYG